MLQAARNTLPPVYTGDPLKEASVRAFFLP
jgi:hypothetical protein